MVLESTRKLLALGGLGSAAKESEPEPEAVDLPVDNEERAKALAAAVAQFGPVRAVPVRHRGTELGPEGPPTGAWALAPTPAPAHAADSDAADGADAKADELEGLVHLPMNPFWEILCLLSLDDWLALRRVCRATRAAVDVALRREGLKCVPSAKAVLGSDEWFSRREAVRGAWRIEAATAGWEPAAYLAALDDVSRLRHRLARGAWPGGGGALRDALCLPWHGRAGFGTPHAVGVAGATRVFSMAVDELGCDVDLRANDGLTPLAFMARWGRDTTARAAVRRGADPRGADDQGRSVVRMAATNGAIECLRLLLDVAPGDLERPDTYGWTPLMAAAAAGRAEALRELLLRGASLQPPPGTLGVPTALHLAAEGGWPDATEILLDAGAAGREEAPTARRSGEDRSGKRRRDNRARLIQLFDRGTLAAQAVRNCVAALTAGDARRAEAEADRALALNRAPAGPTRRDALLARSRARDALDKCTDALADATAAVQVRRPETRPPLLGPSHRSPHHHARRPLLPPPAIPDPPPPDHRPPGRSPVG